MLPLNRVAIAVRLQGLVSDRFSSSNFMERHGGNYSEPGLLGEMHICLGFIAGVIFLASHIT